MTFTIIRQDITKMKVDAIVNAANGRLKMGGGVCGAIFMAAGVDKLQAACNELEPVESGNAVITPGFSLYAKYIIHAIGPVYQQQHPEESEKLLRLSYLNALQLALENKCETIAFPLISSGIYGYPKEEALRVASSAIQDFLAENEMEIYLTIFDKESFAVSRKLLTEVASYIDENYVEKHKLSRRKLLDIEHQALTDAERTRSSAQLSQLEEKAIESSATRVDELFDNLDDSFSTTLLYLINKKGKSDVEVYKCANFDRKLFSKIRTGKGYTPSKRTAIALAIALELTLEETDDLLERAGYALSPSQKFDVIIEYFIINKKYDVFEINELLFHYGLPLLGGS